MNNSEVFAYAEGPGPSWLDGNAWYFPVQLPKEEADKLPRVAMQKVELKVNMCCPKCAEIANEEIREVEGVLDVKIDRSIMKVSVIGRPDPLRVLKKARKLDKNAQFWVDPEPLKQKEDKPKEEGAKGEKKEQKKDGEAEKKDEKSGGEGEKKDEGAKDDKKDDKAGEGKSKEGDKKEEKSKEQVETVASAVQYTPYQQYTPFLWSPYDQYQYRPSQSYQPLYPDYNYMMQFNPQGFYTNPNYLKHVKIAY